MSLKPSHTGAKKWLVRVVSVVAFVSLWQFVYDLKIIHEAIFPPPFQTALSLYDLYASGELSRELLISIFELAVGFSATMAAGIPLGLLMGWSKKIERILQPYVLAIYVSPHIIFIYFFIFVFGISIETKIAYIFFSATPVLALNVASGVKNVDSLLVDVGRGFASSDRQIFSKILVPGSVPYLVSGLRISLGAAFIALVVAEVLLGFSGLGAIIHKAGHEWLWPKVYAGIIIIAIMALLVNQLTTLLEKRYGSWRSN